MSNYNRSSRRNSGSYNSRSSEMYDAVCDKCGRDCKVPFKPSGNKPVYCSECFEKKEGGQYSKGSNDRSRGRSSFRDRDRGRDRGRDRDRQMYDAVCDKCGKDCRVPFRPSGDKPIYCSDCFEGKEKVARTDSNNNEDLLIQLGSINEKLDKIITLMEKTATDMEKPPTKKTTRKKTVVKKKTKTTTKAKKVVKKSKTK